MSWMGVRMFNVVRGLWPFLRGSRSVRRWSMARRVVIEESRKWIRFKDQVT